MNAKYRLMCESWVEKRPESSHGHGMPSKSQGVKWKTRYAMLIVSCERHESEVRFYQKKPRSYTEITDDVIKLQPWEYIVDIPGWIIDKGRPHVLRLRLLPESMIPGQHFRIQIAYQSAEETTAWMRCIQNQTKLTSGIQGHSFGVVAQESPSISRIGVSGKHCLLFVSPQKVILAHKTDRSVVCVWPFQTIRSYSSDDNQRLVIEAGRGAPLGEGVYAFKTRDNDDNVIFDLFDHYTAEAAEEVDKVKVKIMHTPSHAHHTPSDQSKSAPANVASILGSPKKHRKITTEQQKQKMCIVRPAKSKDLEPPSKPPLPQNRVMVPVLPPQNHSSASGIRHTPDIASERSNKKSECSVKDSLIKQVEEEEDTDSKSNIDSFVNRDSVSKGLYDLDKLLYSLESTIHLSQENLPDVECSGLDQPSPKHFAKSNDMIDFVQEDEETDEDKRELAYAINTIEGSTVSTGSNLPQGANVDNQSGTLTGASSIARSKPRIAPKPPSCKISQQIATTPDAKPTPPYARVGQLKDSQV